MANVQKTYALILGIVLSLVGIWGFFTDMVLVFGVNTLQSVVHLIAGIFGVYVGLKGEGTDYSMIVGWVGVLLAVLGFVPATAQLLLNLLNVNMAITWLHLVIGIVSLGVHYAGGKAA